MSVIANFKKRRLAEKQQQADNAKRAELNADALNAELTTVTDAADSVNHAADSVTGAADKVEQGASAIDDSANDLAYSADSIANAANDIKEATAELKKPSAAPASSPGETTAKHKNSSKK
jgi:methyl-accepting chemotaxis protein